MNKLLTSMLSHSSLVLNLLTLISDTDYLRKIGVVNKSNDKDFFDNPGCYRASPNIGIAFLCTCTKEEVNSSTSGPNFESILVN